MTAAGELDNTWVDCLAAYKADVASMRLWDTVCLAGIDPEQVLSSPETLDPKTDTGCEWQKHGTASGFFAGSSITNVATLSEEAMLDIVDALFAKESLFLRGRHVLQGLYQFVYFLRMHELKEKNRALYAYCRGLLRTVDFVARTAMMTSVREEEEFPRLPPEVNTQNDCALAEIIEELSEAIKGITSEALKTRFSFRLQLLQIFYEVFVAEQRRTFSGITEACTTALQTLASLKRNAGDEPKVDGGLFRSEMSVWVSSDVPVQGAPTPAFHETVDIYRTMIDQIGSLKVLFSPGGRTLAGVTEFVETLSAKKPILAVRSVAVLLIFGENPNAMFLHQGSLPMLVLETLANLHGAPLYGKVAERDEAVIKEVAFFCGQRHNVNSFGQHISGAVRHWVQRASRLYIGYWEALLCSRGRAHRRLTNLLEDLGALHAQSLELDTHACFNAQKTGITDTVTVVVEREYITRSLVLTAFVLDLTCQVMSTILHLLIELQLLSKGEYIAWTVYCSHIHTARIENLSTLYLGLSTSRLPIPERRVTRTGIPAVNPVLSMRFPTTPSPLLLSRVEGNGVLADIVFRAAAILESKGQLSLSNPTTSLVPLSQTFHNRMKAFARVQRPGFMTFEHCEEQKKLFVAAYTKQQQEADAQPNGTPMDLNGVSNVAKQLADRTKQLVATVPPSSTTAALAELEKAARATYVSLNLLGTLKPEALAAFELSLGAPSGSPGHLAIVLKRK